MPRAGLGDCYFFCHLKVPSMVKNFIRGECLDCLPTRSKLATKTVLYSENCIRSGNYGENVVHIFVTCPIAIDT